MSNTERWAMSLCGHYAQNLILAAHHQDVTPITPASVERDGRRTNTVIRTLKEMGLVKALGFVIVPAAIEEYMKDKGVAPKFNTTGTKEVATYGTASSKTPQKSVKESYKKFRYHFKDEENIYIYLHQDEYDWVIQKERHERRGHGYGYVEYEYLTLYPKALLSTAEIGIYQAMIKDYAHHHSEALVSEVFGIAVPEIGSSNNELTRDHILFDVEYHTEKFRKAHKEYKAALRLYQALKICGDDEKVLREKLYQHVQEKVETEAPLHLDADDPLHALCTRFLKGSSVGIVQQA
jgi:hypothetical protein